MIDRVVVFTGSKRDFEQYLADSLPENETTIPFMELIQHYNAIAILLISANSRCVEPPFAIVRTYCF